MATIVCARLFSNIYDKAKVTTLITYTSSINLFLIERGYKGSNRYKRMKEVKDKEKLEKELQQKYGVISKPQFNFNSWIKKNYLKEIKAFQFRLNTHFNDEGFLLSALSHSSFLDELKLFNESHATSKTEDGKNLDNDLRKRFELKNLMSDIKSEKLALIGMELAVSVVKNALYRRYPNLTVNVCNDITKFLVSRSTVNNLAKNLAVEELILFSKELENLDISDQLYANFIKEDIISDAFFALIGAIEIDQGYNAAKKFVEDFLIVLTNQEELSKHVNLENPQQELESILEMHGITCKPVARLIAETGIATDFPFFYVGVYCNGFKIGEGSGYSARTGKIDAFKNSVFKCFDQEVDFKSIHQTLSQN